MSKRPKGRWGAVALVALAVGGIGVVGATAGTHISAPLIAMGSCILGCHDTFTGDSECEEHEHSAPTEGDYAWFGGGDHESCFLGACNCPILVIDEEDDTTYVEQKHPWCDPFTGSCSGPGGSSFAQILTEGDEAKIRVALAEGGEDFKEALRLVPERGAIQMVNCADEIQAHIPVSPATLRKVAALLEE